MQGTIYHKYYKYKLYESQFLSFQGRYCSHWTGRDGPEPSFEHG